MSHHHFRHFITDFQRLGINNHRLLLDASVDQFGEVEVDRLNLAVLQLALHPVDDVLHAVVQGLRRGAQHDELGLAVGLDHAVVVVGQVAHHLTHRPNGCPHVVRHDGEQTVLGGVEVGQLLGASLAGLCQTIPDKCDEEQ